MQMTNYIQLVDGAKNVIICLDLIVTGVSEIFLAVHQNIYRLLYLLRSIPTLLERNLMVFVIIVSKILVIGLPWGAPLWRQ